MARTAANRACKKCGQEFLPRQKTQLFCSSKCKKAFFHRKESERLKTQFRLIQDNKIPMPENLSEKDKETIELYTKWKFGVNKIGKRQSRNSFAVRRVLILAGVYKPDPKHNGTAKTGMGTHSRILKKQRMENREKEWREKMSVCLRNLKQGISVKTTCSAEAWNYPQLLRRLSQRSVYRKWITKNLLRNNNIVNDRQSRIWRYRISVCLWALRRGNAIETTCHQHGWNPSLVWNFLQKRKAYKKWKAAHPAKAANIQQYENGRKFDWRSKKYLTENKFQDAIEQLLKDFRVVFVREKKLLHSRSRMDFEINGLGFLECKVCTKSNVFSRAIGQALLCKAEKKEVWFVIPDDISVRKDQLELLHAHEIKMFSETALREKFTGKEVGPVRIKITGIYGFCKCCAKENVSMSRSSAGDVRSFCVDCEDEVKQRVFDSRQNRWI